VTVSVLAPVRDDGPSLREHIRACRRAVSDLHVEFVLLDNMSIDGCCHGLPPEVLIVRTERVESPGRLWRLGCSSARGEGLLWLPGLSSYRPESFRALVVAALDLVAQESVRESDHRRRRTRVSSAWACAAVLTPRARSSLECWKSIPVAGRILSAWAARQLRLVTPCEAAETHPASVTAVPEPKCNPAPAGEAASQHTHARGTDSPKPLSVIITAHNEGAEVLRTVESVRANTRLGHEIIVVDDGSTDGSCSDLKALGIRVIRHTQRVGVAYSRSAGSRAALGDVFAYLDAHQRVERGCLDRCAELAATYGAITCPPCRPLDQRYPVSYGASFRLDPKRGFFSARYRLTRPRQEITRISALRSPAYVIPRSVYPRVAWIAGLRGWGATDLSVALKAFFTDVDILHVNTSPTQHLFRKRIPYDVSWESVWRNHALIARVCFDDRTWYRYWLPAIFRRNLSDDALQELDSQAVLDEREAFMAVKVRPDREFWRGLLRIPEPKAASYSSDH
jgi:glycosyltransferase involved in cell wall biosynthesis